MGAKEAAWRAFKSVCVSLYQFSVHAVIGGFLRVLAGTDFSGNTGQRHAPWGFVTGGRYIDNAGHFDIKEALG